MSTMLTAKQSVSAEAHHTDYSVIVNGSIAHSYV